MKNSLALILMVTLLAVFAGNGFASEDAHPAPKADASHADSVHPTDHSQAHPVAGHDLPHPEISANSEWAGTLVKYILLGMFLPAFLIGPIVRANKQEEPVVAHHDDHGHGDHAADHATDHGHAAHGGHSHGDAKGHDSHGH